MMEETPKTSDREQFYDAEVAPVLLKLARDCRDHGLSMVAVVEYEPREFGRTHLLHAGSSLAVHLVDLAARSEGNVDTLIFAIMKHAREHGHSSLVLAQLGVPLEPSSRQDVH